MKRRSNNLCSKTHKQRDNYVFDVDVMLHLSYEIKRLVCFDDDIFEKRYSHVLRKT